MKAAELLKVWRADPVSPEFEDEARVMNIFIPMMINELSDETFARLWAEACLLALGPETTS